MHPAGVDTQVAKAVPPSNIALAQFVHAMRPRPSHCPLGGGASLTVAQPDASAPASSRAHSPYIQIEPEGHTLPHAPQFIGSTLRSMQTHPQRVVPGEHPSGHDPPKHAVPAQHTRPQPPQ